MKPDGVTKLDWDILKNKYKNITPIIKKSMKDIQFNI